MPEMEFISPRRLEQVIFRFQNTHDGRTDHERIEISRVEQKLLLEKWWDSQKEEDDPCYGVRSSHCYDYSNAREHMNGLMNLCHKVFVPEGLEMPASYREDIKTSNPLTRIYGKLHDGTTYNGYVGPEYLLGWPEFLVSVQEYMGDLTSTLISEALKTLNQKESRKYIYCKVRFKNSYRPYSYRTEDSTLKVGDWVEVPVGPDNKVICERIEKIEYFDEKHVPYPLNKTKLIIGKCDEAEEY